MSKEKKHYCYLTGEKLTASNSSLEHILPNALGGVLKSKNVLCAKANGKLSLDIDNKFNEIFAGTYRRLPIEKDRKTTRGIVGKHVTYGEKVVSKDGKWFPWKPLYDPEKKVVYAQNHKIAEAFIKGMKNQGQIPEGDQIKTLDDMAGSVEIPFDLDNRNFARGLAKIAAGFATLRGIKRSNLRMIIDLEKKEIREEIIAFPYVPTNQWDMPLELKAHNSEHYPIHGLSLFSIPEHKALFCYIELFSTYQYILLLNDDYHGKKFHQSYIYSLLKSKEISAVEYHSSILGEEQTKIFNAKEFKNLTIHQIDDICDMVEIQEQLKPYTYKKFHTLEKYVAELEVKAKIEMIEKTK